MKRRNFLGSLAAVPYVFGQSSGRLANDDQHGDLPMVSGMDKAGEAARHRAVAANQLQAVVTRSYDNLRSGANTRETKLSPAAIRAGGLRKLFSVTLPGDARGAEAQPLILPGVVVDGQSHDLLLTTSMGNQVYCHDANDGTPLWMTRLGPAIQGSQLIDSWVINQFWGVLSTGVLVGQILYVVAWTSPDGTQANSSHALYALNAADGSAAKPPLSLTVSNPKMQRKQRASLTYSDANNRHTIFIPYGTIQETAQGAHGYIQAVDLDSWKVAAEFNVTAQGSGGGVWQAGQGLVVDGEGFLYCMTSNGDYDGVANFGECFLKLRYDGASFAVLDHNMAFLDKSRAPNYDDMDLGSSAPFLIPELGLLGGAGKDSLLYILPWRNLHGPRVQTIWFGFYPGPGVAAVPQDQLIAGRSHHLHSSSITWKCGKDWRLYCWAENGNLRAWKVDKQGAHFLANGQEVASVNAAVPPGGMPGAMLTLSANGASAGVIWATVPLGDANRSVTQGYLAAYDATTFGKYSDGAGAINLLWKSPPFTYNKFNPPVVSGGKVFVTTYDAQVLVFGL